MRADQYSSEVFALKPSFRTPWVSSDPHIGMVFILALILVAASISRFPLIDQFPEVRIGIYCAELLSVVLLFFGIRQRDVHTPYVTEATIMVAVRFAYGALLAKLSFDQPLDLSVQEARFGLLIIITPIAFLFLKQSSNTLLMRLVFCYMLVLLFLDFFVFSVFDVDDLLIFGQRTDDRFLCSILIPLAVTAILAVRQYIAGDNRLNFAMAIALGMFLHSALVTTSRTETLLSASFLGFIVYRRWAAIRWTLPLLVMAIMLLILSNTTIDEGGVAGRNFSLAFDLAWDFFPFGFGSVIDPTTQRVLNLPDTFFTSDYGILMYVLRYGFFGVIMGISILLLWLHFAKNARQLKGYLLLVVPILVYIMLIPLLDYGSLNGGFLLALMWLVPQYITYALPKY